MMHFRFTILIIVLGLLISCATLEPSPMTQQECEAFDPYQHGLDSGAIGKPFNFRNIQTNCEEHGVELSVADYARGWQAGTRQRCFFNESC